MDANHAAIAPLQSIFDAARHFGLTDDEVWQTVNDCFCGADVDETVSDCLDELVKELAHRILARQRQTPDGGSPPPT